MLAKLQQRLEATGAAGEILQAIGVGGAVIGLVIWSVVWGVSDSSYPQAEAAPGSARIDESASATPVPATKSGAGSRFVPERCVAIDTTAWEQRGYAAEESAEDSFSPISEALRSCQVIESSYRVSAEITENVDALGIAVVD
jgi:hypothetical protein